MKARYRLTEVVTHDYGDSPSAGKRIIGRFVALPDGQHHESRPTILEMSVPEGTRPGVIYALTFEQEMPS